VDSGNPVSRINVGIAFGRLCGKKGRFHPQFQGMIGSSNIFMGDTVISEIIGEGGLDRSRHWIGDAEIICHRGFPIELGKPDRFPSLWSGEAVLHLLL